MDETIRFDRTVKNARLVIDTSVISVFNSFKQTKPNAKEAGGILLGRHLLDCDHLAIDEVSTPRIGDQRSVYGFFRGPGHHKTALEIWEKTEGTCVYLGNWHTHPESKPIPSSIDLIDWKNALFQDLFHGNYLYFIIVGTKELCCWEGDKNTGTITKLHRHTKDSNEEIN